MSSVAASTRWPCCWWASGSSTSTATSTRTTPSTSTWCHSPHIPLLTATFGRLSIKSVMTRSFGSTPVTSQEFVEVQRRLVEAFEARDQDAAEQAATDYCVAAKGRVREILALTGGRL